MIFFFTRRHFSSRIQIFHNINVLKKIIWSKKRFFVALCWKLPKAKNTTYKVRWRKITYTLDSAPPETAVCQFSVRFVGNNLVKSRLNIDRKKTMQNFLRHFHKIFVILYHKLFWYSWSPSSPPSNGMWTDAGRAFY